MNSQNKVETNVIEKLQSLNPTYLELVNESMYHAGYFEGKESHFKLTIATEQFIDKKMITRHQLIYNLLAEYMTTRGGTIHALALHTYASTEWNGQSPDSPTCAGQNK